MFYQETHVFPSGGNSNYRIPSLVVTNSGTVLAFCTDRIGTLKDHADEIALVCAVKKPGEGWSAVRELAHLPGWSCNIGSAVYDDVADKVIVTFQRSPVAKNEFGKYTAEAYFRECDGCHYSGGDERDYFAHMPNRAVADILYKCIGVKYFVLKFRKILHVLSSAPSVAKMHNSRP
jgi:hypothetical protein